LNTLYLDNKAFADTLELFALFW